MAPIVPLLSHLKGNTASFSQIKTG